MEKSETKRNTFVACASTFVVRTSISALCAALASCASPQFVSVSPTPLDGDRIRQALAVLNDCTRSIASAELSAGEHDAEKLLRAAYPQCGEPLHRYLILSGMKTEDADAYVFNIMGDVIFGQLYPGVPHPTASF